MFGFVHRLRSHIVNAVRHMGERIQQSPKPSTDSLIEASKRKCPSVKFATRIAVSSSVIDDARNLREHFGTDKRLHPVERAQVTPLEFAPTSAGAGTISADYGLVSEDS